MKTQRIKHPHQKKKKSFFWPQTRSCPPASKSELKSALHWLCSSGQSGPRAVGLGPESTATTLWMSHWGLRLPTCVSLSHCSPVAADFELSEPWDEDSPSLLKSCVQLSPLRPCTVSSLPLHWCVCLVSHIAGSGVRVNVFYYSCTFINMYFTTSFYTVLITSHHNNNNMVLNF